TEQDDDEVERRMHAERDRQSTRAIAVFTREMVVIGGGAAVQSVGDDLDAGAQFRLEDAWPAILQRVARRPLRIVAPGQRVAVAQHRLHRGISVDEPIPAWPAAPR